MTSVCTPLQYLHNQFLQLQLAYPVQNPRQNRRALNNDGIQQQLPSLFCPSQALDWFYIQLDGQNLNQQPTFKNRYEQVGYL